MKRVFEILSNYIGSVKIDIRFNVPVAGYTSLKIGGIADAIISPEPELFSDVIDTLRKNQIPYTVIGGGTNCLFKDRGIDGILVLMNRFRHINIGDDQGSFQEIYVEAGCPLKRVINLSSDLGLSGLEGLAGIPGTVGGAIAGNAGSFGYEIKDVLRSIDLYLPDKGKKRLASSEITFGYRKAEILENSIIIGATMLLKRDDPHYIKERVKRYAKEKSLRQPISKRSAGCVFKNFNGLSAGKLIDDAGCKGMRVGDVEVSRLHGNFFINLGKGSSEDFIRLMDKVAERVRVSSGVILEPEIKIIGRS